ncbi:MAG: DUF1800 domain-containing protein [Fimbriimonadaceae bacterium]|nr:DUF1800 domain-containing protein [Fimbriimonadaceae bacterium]
MTAREKIAHLYRRLAFGATPAQLDIAERRGFAATLDDLIHYHRTEPNFNVSPHEFSWRYSTKEEADLGSWRYRTWWTFQMMATNRPLEEKLTLFWHGHFAVSDTKIEDGPIMLDYLQTIRTNAGGKFENLAEAMAKSPAVMRYLDMNRSARGNPNENFAREIMELFTLGIGNYSEEDVKEAARAFTGWGYIHTYWELPGDATTKLKDRIKYDRPFSSFAYMPALRDPSPKTILGVSKDWTGEELVRFLSRHPKTAEFIATKLWAFFASSTPNPTAIAKMATTFRRTGGDILKTVRTMAESPEFFSSQVVAVKPKTPVDYVIGIARRQGIGEALLALRPKESTTESEIPKKILDDAGYAAYRMNRQGLSLLYPPDVSGWDWGNNWITPAALTERYQYHGHWLPLPENKDVASQSVIGWLKTQKPADSPAMAARLAEYYDVRPNPETLDVLKTVFDYFQGPKLFETPGRWGEAHFAAMKYLVAAPEMHLC